MSFPGVNWRPTSKILFLNILIKVKVSFISEIILLKLLFSLAKASSIRHQVIKFVQNLLMQGGAESYKDES